MSTINGTSGNDTLKGTSGSDFIYGLDGDDILWGYDGNDWLNGGLGADILYGGLGNDTYFVDNAQDKVVDSNFNGGDDWVFSSISYTLTASVEHLILTGAANLNGYGNTLDNSLTGNAGNNTLNGKGGADLMKGGLGDDIYIVENQADKVGENANAGKDSVSTTVSYALSANVENLVLLGNDNIFGTGNGLNNKIIGNDGGNKLDGAAGADTMTGGKGDDIYVVDSNGDVVTEKTAEGYDWVQSWGNHTLEANVEKLSLYGNTALIGIGNALDNVIEGNPMDNVLEGADGVDTLNGGSGNDILFGGLGADTMQGGSGDDTFIVGDSGDVVVEDALSGTDTVETFVSWTLGANFENLTLARGTDTDGTGNDTDNVIRGSWGENTMNGMEGNDTLIGLWGNDSLYGGLGDDTYQVSRPLLGIKPGYDAVFENSNEGTDTVKCAVDYTLGANLENLILVGIDNYSGTGNSANNTIQGNIGNNILDGGSGADMVSYANAGAGVTVSLALGGPQNTGGAGLDTLVNFDHLMGSNFDDILSGDDKNNSLTGGSGADTLFGGAGSDRFRFFTGPGQGETDTILDFVSGADSLRLKQTVFSQLGDSGQFAVGDERFFIGVGAHDANDRIIYNANNGALYYDTDGDGANAAIQFASLTGQPNLVATDIWAV